MSRESDTSTAVPDGHESALLRPATLAGIFAAVLVVALAAYRATIGMSFYDDTFYAVVPWRFANGARFLIDELSLPAVGSMASVPLVWIWERTVGLTGIVLATRLLWIVLAAVGATVCARMLRGSARLGVAVIAAAVPLLAPPYHVFAPTYNTVSSLLFTLAVLFGFAALRDRRASLAACAGVSLALGAASYSPLIAAAAILLATLAFMTRDWRLAGHAIGASLATGVVVGTVLFYGVSLGDLRNALALGTANVNSMTTPLDKMRWVFGNTGLALVSPWLLPMWTLALVASVSRIAQRVGAAALFALPVAAALPGFALLARNDHLTFGTSAGSWLITLCAGLLVPTVLAVRRLGRHDLQRLLVLAAPFSAVGYVTVALVTGSTWNRGMPAVALAPFAVVLLVCWGTAITEMGGPVLFASGATVALAVVAVLLFSSVFGDRPSAPHVRVAQGAYAGLLTTVERRDRLRQLAEEAPRWVNSDTYVTFLGRGEAYLAVGGRPHTPATWLPVGQAGSAALEYFERKGRTPDVVFVNDADMAFEGGYSRAQSRDPALRWVLAHYRRADSVGGFSVFVRP